RTYPGRPERGVVRYTRLDDHQWSFYAVPPRRFGDIGAIKRFGLFGNGGWYPQPIVEDGLPIAEWTVRVRIPDGTLGALGDTWGSDTLEWSGTGERASLAVLPRGVATSLPITNLAEEQATVTLLSRRKPRKVLVKELSKQLADTATEGASWRGVVVEAPLRRRLARPGRGLAYVSDRAYRVTAGFQRFHRVGVTRGVMEAFVDHGDPFVRAVSASGLSLRHAQVIAGADARSLLRYLSWIPTIDAILHSHRMPYYAEILEQAHPGDPVRDDLVEMFAPHAPGTAIALQLEDRYGPGTAWVVSEGVVLGLSLERSAIIAGVSPSWLQSWRTPYPEQDYRLTVQPDPPLVRVEREAPSTAPVEAVVVAIDGERSVRVMGPGPDTVVLLPPQRPTSVVVDPGRHTSQASRLGDAWPPRYHVNLAASITSINLSEGYLAGWGAAYLRRSGDTHNVLSGTIYTNSSSLVGLSFRFTRKEGRLLDGLSRPHRISLSFNPTLLNPRYASTDDGRVSLGAGLQYGWSSRTYTLFPVRGHGVALSLNAGFVPSTDRRWARVGAGWSGVASPHPRHALAAHADGAIATGDVDHRLLSLGGIDNLRSIPVNEVIGTRRAVGLVEYRTALIRHASVPMLLGFGTELQLDVGGEVGAVWVDGAAKSAAGITVGITGVGEVFGFEERAVGVTVGWPVWVDGFESSRAGKPAWYLRWAQAF
ncbi:MAG: hypothetical protein JRI25_18965, partial [Deltaproteobacteria bacterium]|nr:hypothetical protein [Deltaproteobacteria bacterium]